MGVLSSPHGRYIGHCAFNDFEQGLLHPLSRHIPGNRWVFTLSRYFVDLVDINDPLFGKIFIFSGRLVQFE